MITIHVTEHGIKDYYELPETIDWIKCMFIDGHGLYAKTFKELYSKDVAELYYGLPAEIGEAHLNLALECLIAYGFEIYCIETTEPTDFRNLLIRTAAGYHFHMLKVGKYLLSIQASEGHYCNPKKRVNPFEYTSFEVALFNGNVNKLFNKLSIFPKEIRNFFNRYEFITVAGWLPVEKTQKVFDICFKKSTIKEKK